MKMHEEPINMHRNQSKKPSTNDNEAKTPAGRRRRYTAILEMIESWQADRSGYEERVWPDLVRQIEADRLSPRERFRG